MKDKKGRTPIHIAASQGKEKIVELLLGKVKDGGECEGQEQKDCIALSCQSWKEEGCRGVVEKGANADAEDKDNRTLHLAVMGDGKEVGGIVEPLLAKMKNNIAKDSRGQTALHVAAAPGKERALEKLLANRDVKAAIDGPDNKKWTPPQYGANQKRKRASEIPKNQGADTPKQSTTERIPFSSLLPKSGLPKL